MDEHGGTEGLVTAADLTGEIVGDEIQESKAKPPIQEIEGKTNTWLVAGDLEIIEINRQLKLDLPEADDHHTLAGFLLEEMQHIPAVGELHRYKNLLFEITVMNGPRIEKVKLILSQKSLLEG